MCIFGYVPFSSLYNCMMIIYENRWLIPSLPFILSFLLPHLFLLSSATHSVSFFSFFWSSSLSFSGPFLLPSFISPCSSFPSSSRPLSFPLSHCSVVYFLPLLISVSQHSYFSFFDLLFLCRFLFSISSISSSSHIHLWGINTHFPSSLSDSFLSLSFPVTFILSQWCPYSSCHRLWVSVET